MTMLSVEIHASPALTCFACSVVFWMPKMMYERAVEKRGAMEWFCPNGHAQHFLGLTEAERARRERDEARAQRDKAWVERDKAEREKEAAIAATARLKRRHARGVCSFCNRTFGDVAKHMQTKHPEKVGA